MKRISDEAHVAIEFPDKVYMGSFSRASRYEVSVEDGGLFLKLARETAPKRRFDMHLHHHLLVDILTDWAAALKDDRSLTPQDRNDLREAVDALSAALGDGAKGPGGPGERA